MREARLKVVNVDCNLEYAEERSRIEAVGAELILKKVRTEDELIEACAGVDVILTENSDTLVTPRVIAGLRACRGVVHYGVGVDSIDVAAATENGIVVANAAAYCTEEVSDHAVALLLAGARRLLPMDRTIRAGGWSDFPRDGPLLRISNLTLGLIGLGRIARATARKMSGFRLRILAADPYLPSPAEEPGVERVTLEQLLAESDLISIHVPLTRETRGLIGEAAFRVMKPTAILVNTSRGKVVDQDALVRALEEKRISGAGLDVMAEEPLPASSPLRQFGNVIFTPHFGSESLQALRDLHLIVAESAAALLQGYWPPFPVNPGVRPRLPLRPWSEFAKK
jgi:D-3-phosphoglycerate dehydrogenase